METRKVFSLDYESILIIISYLQTNIFQTQQAQQKNQINNFRKNSRRKCAITFIISEDELSCYYGKGMPLVFDCVRMCLCV